MTTQEQPDKLEVVRYLLEKEGRVMLCVDATHTGVAVPRRFATDRGLRLVLSSRMPQPIQIGLTSIESELRFGGVPHYCIIPYGALWGAFNPDSGHGVFWNDDMPPEVRESFDVNATAMTVPPGIRGHSSRKTPPPPPKAAGRPRLQVIEGGGEREEGEEPANPPPPRRPNLRLVE